MDPRGELKCRKPRRVASSKNRIAKDSVGRDDSRKEGQTRENSDDSRDHRDNLENSSQRTSGRKSNTKPIFADNDCRSSPPPQSPKVEITRITSGRKSSTIPLTASHEITSPLISNLRRSIHDYFPLRRQSTRVSEIKMKEEKYRNLIALVANSKEIDFEIRYLDDKGRAVFTKRPFEKNEFVLEYSGDLINLKEAKSREGEYATDKSLGCYMFYFRYLCKSYCIDATSESGRLGRLVNHSRLRFNLATKVVSINGRPRLLLMASRKIESGEELLYDYGDRSKTSLREHPWLAT